MLLGIPIVVKDNIAYEGYPTTNGYWSFGSVSWESATIVQTLLDAGAVVLGKSNMATGAQDAQFSASDAVGETLNAYGTDLSTGGSSGGSASAVSLNFCYAGLGTDTNASLRYPAVLNGCVALRPTKGLLDREGVIILNHSRDVPGVITRTVKDQALVLGEMTGIDYYTNLNGNALEGMRIGILRELCYSEISLAYRWERKIDTEVKDAFYDAVANLRALGAKVFEVSIPNIFTLAENCEYDSSSSIERFLSKYEKLFEECDLDAVIFPTYLHTPDNSLKYTGWKEDQASYFFSNCSKLSSPIGVPEMAIPIAYHSKGSGIGLEIAALKGQEQLLLDIAYTYTEHYDTRRVPETAPSLYEAKRNIEELLEEERKSAPRPVTEVTEAVTEDTSTQEDDVQTDDITESTPTLDFSTEEVTSTESSEDNGVSEEPSPLPLVISMVTILLPAGAWVCYKYFAEKSIKEDPSRRAKPSTGNRNGKKEKRKQPKGRSRKKKVHK